MIHRRPPDQPVSADPLDAFFDGEMDEGAARRMFGALRADVRAAEDYVRTQQVLTALREPIEGPDVADPVLSRLERAGVLRAQPRRRWFTGGRLAAAAGLIMGLSAVVAIHQLTPERPVRVASGGSGSAASPAAVAAPPAAVARGPREPAPVRDRFALSAAPRTLTPLARPAEGGVLFYGGVGPDFRLTALPPANAWNRGWGSPLWALRPGDTILGLPTVAPTRRAARPPERIEATTRDQRMP
ncbi:MAG: hypothetical protein WD749_00730 [Phycisphaerales bacterium]